VLDWFINLYDVLSVLESTGSSTDVTASAGDYQYGTAKTTWKAKSPGIYGGFVVSGEYFETSEVRIRTPMGASFMPQLYKQALSPDRMRTLLALLRQRFR
jgi:hypothetical protein